MAALGRATAALPGWMRQKQAPPAPFVLDLPDESATIAFGRRLAAELETGDVVGLSGDLGVGKTTLARAILRAYLDDPDLEAPSPTFTLIQAYDGPRGRAVHADFYRIAGGGELVELGFEEEERDAVVLVEWPERAGGDLTPKRLDVALELDAVSGARRAIVSGEGRLAERIRQGQSLIELIARAGWSDASRIQLQGDASTRAYERLVRPSGESAILMVSPPRSDGPPVRRGKPYSAIAKLAESVHAFAAMDRGLVEQGLSAPRILAEDLETGVMLLEDLGTEPVVDAEGPIAERYAEAVRLLAALHARELPNALPVSDTLVHAIPRYDLDALLIEVDLLLDWYMPHVVGTKPSGSVRAEFGHVWRDMLTEIVAAPPTWTLRDYHSPNLIWLPDREGIRRVGLLDFQDAVLGPPAYDVASLLQDARVTVPPELELRLLVTYAGERRRDDPSFDMSAFASAYAIMGAQRATKILGIFARLDRRDGKPQYLEHLPRIRAYLARSLAHPALVRMRAWFHYHAGDLVPSEAYVEVPEPESPTGRSDSSPPHAEVQADGEPRSTPHGRASLEAGLRPAPQAEEVEGLAAVPPAAIVLSAGLGTRMRPITDTRPKPLVEVGGRALLDHALSRLAAAGIRRAVVNVHHLADMIESHLAAPPEDRAGLDVVVSDERDALLETGGGVKRALPMLGAEFLVLNSDSLWTEADSPNLPRLVAAWDQGRMDILLLLAPRESLGYDGAGDFVAAFDGALARRPPAGTAPFVYAGLAMMKAGLFDDTPEGAFSLNLLFDRAIAAGRLFGLALDGEWLHVGTPDAIAAAEARLGEVGSR